MGSYIGSKKKALHLERTYLVKKYLTPENNRPAIIKTDKI